VSSRSSEDAIKVINDMGFTGFMGKFSWAIPNGRAKEISFHFLE
jgi:hypothetical protein